MALKKVGSQLVAEGINAYINNMGNAASATKKIGEAGKQASAGIDKMSQSSQTASQTTKQVGDSAQQASEKVGGLTKMGVALANIFANLVSNAIQKVLGSLANLGKQALNEVASFERLTFSMESLIARELRTFDATLSMADALEQAGPAAEGLLGWIQKLAIESPFGVEGVAAAFKTAQAYGFTAQEAMNLTQVMIDFASATGATEPVMNQIALALGQIRAKGKVAGQEILQLVNAGVGVNAILKEMGFTLDDVSKGLVSADAFMEAFTKTMENDFGGAAQRSSLTLTGLLNTLEDVRSIGLRTFFGPIFQEIQPHLAAFVTKLQELMPILGFMGQMVGRVTGFLIENREAIIKTIAVIGGMVAAFLLVANAGAIFTAVAGLVTGALAAIGAAIAFLMSPIGILAVAIAGLAGLFIFSFQDIQFNADNFFSDFGNNMFNFGRDLVLAFAEGMAAAANYVIDVLIQIGNIIANWLAPGSPPRLLPDIDDWGTEAMNQYFRGFLNADFGIFNKLSGMVARFIRSLDIPEVDIIPRILGARGAIAEAVAQLQQTGNITAAAIQKIMSAIGANNPALEGYIQALIRVEAASQAVAQAQEAVTAANEAVALAQERLNNVSERYAGILKPMNDELDEIAKRRQEVIDDQRKAELQAIISDENAPALARELALMELREIELRNQIAATEEVRDAKLAEEQAAVDAAMAEEEAAQAALDAQQEQLQAQQELLSAQEQMIAAQTENNELIKQQIALLERLGRESAVGGGGERAKAGGAGKLTLPGIPSLPTDFGALAGIESPFDSIIEGWKDKIDGLLGEITGKFDKVGRKLEELQKTWGTVFTNIINLPIWFEIRYKIKEIRRLIEDIINPLLEGDWGTAWENAQAAVSGVNFTDVLAALGGLALAIVGGPGVIPAVGLLGVAWATNWGGIRDKVTEVWEGVVRPALESLHTWLAANLPTALQTLSDFWTNTLLPAIQDVWTWVSGTLIPFITGTLVPIIETRLTTALQVLSKFWTQILLPAVKLVWGFIQNSIIPLFEALDKLLRVTVTLAVTVLQGAWENILLPALKSVWEFIKDSLQPIFETIWGFIQDNLIPIIGEFTDKIDPLKTMLSGAKLLLDGFKAGLDGISTAIETVIGWIGNLIDAIGNIEIPEILTPGSPTPFEMGLRGIASALQEINRILPETDRRLGLTSDRAALLTQNMAAFSMPVTSASLANSGGSTVYNQNRVTVGENINVSDRLDFNMLINALQQVMNNQFPGTL